MSRTVRIKDTDRSGLLTFQINATTFGELKDEITSLDSSLSFSNKRAIVRETRVTLDSSEAVLPEGSFTLYLMPEKSKAGADWSSFSFHQLRSFCSSVGLPANGVTREQMEASLSAHYAESETSTPDVERAISLIEEAIAILRGEDNEQVDDIEEDFATLRIQLGL